MEFAGDWNLDVPYVPVRPNSPQFAAVLAEIETKEDAEQERHEETVDAMPTIQITHAIEQQLVLGKNEHNKNADVQNDSLHNPYHAFDDENSNEKRLICKDNEAGDENEDELCHDEQQPSRSTSTDTNQQTNNRDNQAKKDLAKDLLFAKSKRLAHGRRNSSPTNMEKFAAKANCKDNTKHNSQTKDTRPRVIKIKSDKQCTIDLSININPAKTAAESSRNDVPGAVKKVWLSPLLQRRSKPSLLKNLPVLVNTGQDVRPTSPASCSTGLIRDEKAFKPTAPGSPRSPRRHLPTSPARFDGQPSSPHSPRRRLPTHPGSFDGQPGSPHSPRHHLPTSPGSDGQPGSPHSPRRHLPTSPGSDGQPGSPRRRLQTHPHPGSVDGQPSSQHSPINHLPTSPGSFDGQPSSPHSPRHLLPTSPGPLDLQSSPPGSPGHSHKDGNVIPSSPASPNGPTGSLSNTTFLQKPSDVSPRLVRHQGRTQVTSKSKPPPSAENTVEPVQSSTRFQRRSQSNPNVSPMLQRRGSASPNISPEIERKFQAFARSMAQCPRRKSRAFEDLKPFANSIINNAKEEGETIEEHLPEVSMCDVLKSWQVTNNTDLKVLSNMGVRDRAWTAPPFKVDQALKDCRYLRRRKDDDINNNE